MYREAEQKIDRLISDPTAARMVCCLSGSGNGRVTLAELRKLIDSRQCDVLVVDELSCFGRRQSRLWAFLDQAVHSGVRIISLAEELDSEAANWRLALSVTALLTGIRRPRNRTS
jgi:DNA invertase Pin-like site-specific DNA recombinase